MKLIHKTTPPLRGTPPQEGNGYIKVRDKFPSCGGVSGFSLTGWLKNKTSHSVSVFMQKRPLKKGGREGFTLIELLVAMAIFAVIGTVLFIQIHTVIKAKAKVEIHAMQLAQMQKTLQMLEQDIEQMVQRPRRNASGQMEGALIGDNEKIELTRTGWSIPPAAENPRSELQRVSYQWQNNQLIRSYWLYVDGGDESYLKKLTLLNGVQTFNFNYWYRDSAQGALQSSDRWPLADSHDLLAEKNWPVMIEIEFTTDEMGAVRRLFLLTKTANWSASDASGS